MSLTSTSSVERYDPAEVLTDRWEMGSMARHEKGQYVYWDDYEELSLKFEALQRQNLTLSEALGNLSRQLAKAGETELQPWHSSNEKEAFKIMAKMGAYGFEALASDHFE